MAIDGETIFYLSPVVAILFGGLITWVRPWVKKGDDVRKQARLIRVKLSEKASITNAILLDHSRALLLDEPLRGDGFHTPDHVGCHTRDVLNLARISAKLDQNVALVCWSSKCILYTIIVAVIFTLFTILHHPARDASPWVTVVLILFQIVSVKVNHTAWSFVDQTEDDV